jgi:hypothetical protein
VSDDIATALVTLVVTLLMPNLLIHHQ